MLKALFIAGILTATIGSAAHASTIDLTDASYFNPTYGGPTSAIKSFQEIVDGVTFTFATPGTFGGIGVWNGGAYDPGPYYRLALGGGGGTPTSFSVSANTDVTLNSFLGLAQQYNTHPIFDVTGSGVSSIGNAFGTEGFSASATPGINSFVGGPLSLLANTLYTFSVTNPGVVTVGHLTGMDFTKASVVGAVPVPAALPLLLSGIAGLGLFGMRRRQSAT